MWEHDFMKTAPSPRGDRVRRPVGAGVVLLGLLTLAISLLTYHVLDRQARATAAGLGRTALLDARKLSLDERESLMEEAAIPADEDRARVVSVVGSRGATLAGPRVTPILPANDGEALHDLPFDVAVDGGGSVEAYGGYLDLGGGRRLFIGEKLDAHRDNIYPSLAIIVGCGGITALMLLAYGAWTRRRVERQLREIVTVLEGVSRGEFGPRLPSRGRDDEWDLLRAHINSSSDRLRSLIEQLGSLADLVSHELGSAVGRVEHRIRKIDEAADLATARELANSALGETARIRGTVQALLDLSEIKAGNRHRFEWLDLGKLAADVIELFATTANMADVTLTSDLGPAEILGERDLVTQLLANLIDNALKYTPAGGTVTVETRRDAMHVRLTVRDTGPGIPRELRATVIEPARRLERDKGKPGFGYGLAVVDAVMRRHGGTLEMPDVDRGLRVDALFPLRPTVQNSPSDSRAISR
jgi:signal transduction histidine kinase